MKIYIAGPISGRPEQEYRDEFANAARMLEMSDCEVLNPTLLCAHLDGKGAEWIDYMKVCIPAVFAADAVLMLPEWEKSKGAAIEHEIAKARGITVYYMTEILIANCIKTFEDAL